MCCCNSSSRARPWRWWAEPSACFCGVGVAKLITLIIGFPTSVQLWSVLLGMFMATATGIFFGVYPASKAAKLDPVVALRAEL
jgi:putative ABC transport system permease protein